MWSESRGGRPVGQTSFKKVPVHGATRHIQQTIAWAIGFLDWSTWTRYGRGEDNKPVSGRRRFPASNLVGCGRGRGAGFQTPPFGAVRNIFSSGAFFGGKEKGSSSFFIIRPCRLGRANMCPKPSSGSWTRNVKSWRNSSIFPESQFPKRQRGKIDDSEGYSLLFYSRATMEKPYRILQSDKRPARTFCLGIH